MKKTLIIITIVICSLASAITVDVGIRAFNAGEVSPYIYRRVDLQKYDNSCQTLQNMLIRSEGPVERRPGSKYIIPVKYSAKTTRLIPFEYSKTDAYIIEVGDEYMRFYRNGGQILDVNDDTYEIETIFQESEILGIQYVQRANVMYLVDGNDPPQKLSRTDHDAWTIDDVNFTTGPFLDQNKTTITVEPNGVLGTITLIADANIFDEDHEGVLWRIGYRRTDNPLTGTLDANESSAAIIVGGTYYYNIQGSWDGDAILEKSYDSGSTWEAVYPRENASTAINEDRDDVESEDNVLYRVTMENYVSGKANYYLRVANYIDYGVVKITDWIDANEVTAIVVSELADANNPTTLWSEGAWSDYRGWPQTIEFHEQRLMFGGSRSYPQTIWASKTASGADNDYEDMSSGVDDDDALIYILPGQNPLQWMLSQTYLLIGTLSGVGRWGSSDDDTPITPTEPTNYRVQSSQGSAYIQAAIMGDAILYVERGGRRIREFAYNLERNRFVAPDITVLAEHIAGDGIIQIAYQSRPNSNLWCVREDGDMAVLVYQREEEVVGWSRCVTDGDYKSVAVISGVDEDEVWYIVERTIDGNDYQYIEQFQSRNWGSDQSDCWFVDSGLSWGGGDAVNISAATKASPCMITVSTWPVDTNDANLADGDQVRITGVLGMTQLNNNIYTVDDASILNGTFTLNNSADSADINSVAFGTYLSGGIVQRVERDFTGLDHCEGKIVTVLADGETEANELVSNGAVRLDPWCNKVTIGLPYTSILHTLPIVLQIQTGSTAGKTAKMSSIKIDLYKSLGVKCGMSASDAKDILFYESGDDVGNPIPLFTGVKTIPFLHGFYEDASVYLESNEPLPFCCRMIQPQIMITER